MGYLRHRASGAVTELLNSDSAEYQKLVRMKFQAATTAAAAPASVTGLEGGTSPGSIAAGQPIWEEIAYEDTGLPDPSGGRVIVIAIPASAAGSDETVQLKPQGVPGSLTDVEYVPDAAIPGDGTNNRSITLNEVKVTGTGSPARAVTALAAIMFTGADAAHKNAGGNVPTALIISQAAFTDVPPDQLEVVSAHGGTGAADPGGVLYAVYTRA